MSEQMPFGDVPPEPEVQEEIQDTDIKEEKPVVEPEVKAEEKPDYEKRYAELQKKFGEHSNVVGDLRKQNEALAKEMEKLKETAKVREEKAKNSPPPTDYEKMLSEIAQKADNGDITLEQALLESAKITYQRTKEEADADKQRLIEEARNEVRSILDSKDSEAVVKDFHDKNPDFMRYQQEGKLDEIKAQDPLLDDLSAYYKAQLLAEKERAAAEFERGKQEALRVASGSEKASKVLSDPGTSMQQQRKPSGPMTEAKLKASMRARLDSLETT